MTPGIQPWMPWCTPLHVSMDGQVWSGLPVTSKRVKSGEESDESILSMPLTGSGGKDSRDFGGDSFLGAAGPQIRRGDRGVVGLEMLPEPQALQGFSVYGGAQCGRDGAARSEASPGG